MAFIDGTVVNVALPALQSSFHATVVDVQWIVEAYGLCLSALILVGGALGDSLGRRLVFLLGVTVFSAASVACGASSSIGHLLIWRGVQGIGAAFLVPSSLAIISAAFDESSRGRAIGTWSGFTAITTAFGPVLGGWLIENASWRWAFFINVPLAIIVIAVSLRHIPESRSAVAKRLDWPGAVLATVCMGGMVYGFIESEALGWGNPRVFGSVLTALACLVLFAIVEARAASPMVPLTLFNSRSFTGANLLTLALYAALGIFFFLFPMNMIQVQGYSATAAGASALPAILLMFLLSRWSGGLITRYGPRIPLILGPLVAALGFLLFARPSVGGTYWTTFFPAFVVLGFGMAVSVAPLTTVVMSSVERDRVGTASGINNAVARVAGVLAVAILGVVMVRAFSYGLQHSLTNTGLAPNVLRDIQSNAVELGGLEVPASLDASKHAIVRLAVVRAFVFGFRVVMLICAGLAAISTGIALRMIPARLEEYPR
jgi:EmrB/QacA subfamily drug resistance transporter